MTDTTTLRVDFVSESAGYQNTFGWYNKATGVGGILFASVEAEGRHAPLDPGRSSVEFTVATADLGNIEYFLIPNGGGLSANTDSELSRPVKVIQLSDGSWAVATLNANGSVQTSNGKPNILVGEGANAFFTEKSKNEGGVDHASSTVGSNQTASTLAGDTADGATGLIAWEDLAATRNKNGTWSKPGDADYNDAVFRVSIKNDAPDARNDNVTVSEDAGATVINVLANDSDSDGDVVRVISVDDDCVLGSISIAPNGSGIIFNPGAAYQNLQAGETRTETFSYKISDGNGGTDTATVTLKIVGANDAPVVASAADLAGSVTEKSDGGKKENSGTLSTSGEISFSDVDCNDNHTVSVTPQGAGYLGALTAKIGNGGRNPADVVDWKYSVPAGALDFLSEGQTLTQNYTVTIRDEAGAAVSRTVTITLKGENDKPVVTNAVSQGSVTELADNAVGENTATHTSTGTIEFADVDLADSHTITVTPSGGNYRGSLTAVVSNTSTGDGAGVVTWVYSVDDAALDDLTASQTLTQTYKVKISDGQGGTVEQTVTIKIKGANDSAGNSAPTITSAPQAAAVSEIADGSPGENATTHTRSGTIGFADANPSDSHTASFAPQAGGYLGTFALGAVNQSGDTVGWTFTVADSALDSLAAGQTLTQVYTVTINDGQGGTATQAVTVTLTGTNDVPVITSSAQSGQATEIADGAAAENTAVHAAGGAVSFADADTSDVHGATFSPQAGGYLGTFALGAVNQSGNSVGWSFTVADSALDGLKAGETLTQLYDVTVSDGQGGSVTEVVTVTLTGTNDAPVVTGGERYVVAEDALITFHMINLLANDTDVDGDTLSVQSVGNAVGGTVQFDSGNGFLHFAPDANFSGQASFTYLVTDGNGETATGTVFVDVPPLADLPVLSAPASVSGNEDTAISLTSFHAWLVDTDGSETLVLRLTGFPEGSTFSLGALDAGTRAWVISDPAEIASLAGTPLTLTPPADWSGNFSLGVTATVTDQAVLSTGPSTHSATSSASIAVTVNAVDNDAPEAQPVEAAAGSDGNVTVTAVFTDPDEGETYTFTVDTTGTLGTVINNGDGTFSYSAGDAFDYLPEGGTATDTFTYTVDDGNGGSSTQTVTITITGVNDAPQPQPVSAAVDEDGTVTVVADHGDPDQGDTHTYSLDTTGTIGTVIDNGDGTFTYGAGDAFEHLGEGETATDTFTYTVTDGLGASSTQTVTVTVTGRNDAPVALAIAGAANEDGPAIVLTADVSDADLGDSRSYAIDTTGTIGAVIDNGDGTFSYSANGAFEQLGAGETATDTFNYTVTDAAGASSTQTATVTVTGQNDAPVSEAIAVQTNDNLEVLVSPSFTDPDQGDTHTVVLDTAGTLGVVLDNGNGFYTYQAFNGAFDYLGANETATDTFTFTITDAAGASTTQTVTVTVTGRNEGPVAEAISAEITGDGTATLTASYTDPDLNDTHTFAVDDTFLQGTVTNNGDGTFSYDTNGAFAYLKAGESTTDNFDYTVTDAAGASSLHFATVTIHGVNDAPVAQAVSGVASEDGPSIVLAADFADSDANDSHTFAVDTSGTSGSVVNNGNGTFSYSANGAFEHLGAGETATDTFTYTVTDAAGASSTHTVTVTITGQNDAPVALAIFSAANEGGPSVTLTADVSDADLGDSRSYAIDTTGTVGSVVDNGDGTFNYSANGAFEHLGAGETATDTFTYTVTDGAGASSTQTATVTVVGQNDGPSAANDTATAAEAGGLANGTPGVNPTGNVLANDTDPDANDTRSVSAVQGAGGNVGVSVALTYGAITIAADGSYTYTVDNANAAVQALRTPADTLTDTVTYTMVDSAGAASTATLTVTIQGANDAPATVFTPTHADENGLATVVPNFSDPDQGDTHTFSLDTALTQATLVDNGDGTFSYDAGNTFDHLQVGSIAYDTFYYTVTDSSGASRTQQGLIVNHGRNDAPVAQAIAASANEDGPSVTLTADFDDVDSFDAHTFAVDTTGTLGSVVDNGDGTFSYSANGAFEHLGAGETATDTFTYTVADAAGASSTQTATVTITGSNDGPIASAVTGSTSATAAVTLAASFTDADANDTHSVALQPGDILGTVVNNGDGTFTYDPNGAFGYLLAGQTATESFGYTVTDSAGASSTYYATVTINGQNDAPVAVNDTATAVEAGGIANGLPGVNPSGNVLTNDTDIDFGDTRTVSAVQGSAGHVGMSLALAYGTILIAADGAYSYILDNDNAAVQALRSADDTLTDTVTYTMVDGSGVTSTATLTLTVEGANDAPIAVAASVSMEEDTILTGTLTATDVDDDDFNFALVDQATHGTVVVNPDGTYSYTPVADFVGSDSFTFVANDGSADSAVQTVSISVTSAAPVLANDTNAVREGNTLVHSGIEAVQTFNLGGMGAGYRIVSELGDGELRLFRAGDLNGDGLADVLVGALSNDGIGTNSGAGYVVYGKADSSPINLSDVAAGNGGYKINGQAAGSLAGTNMESLGDVNGDGLGDIAISASAGVSSKLYVVFGQMATTPINLSDVAAGIGGYTFTGVSLASHQVAAIGDVNGDGLSDMAIGVGANNTTYVVYGKATGGTVDLSTFANSSEGYRIIGEVVGDNFGYAVAGVGDVNGDGLGDMLIGAPNNDVAGAAAGAGYVIYGKSGPGDINVASLGTGGTRIVGEATLDFAGQAIALAGDVNGDGISDYVINSSDDDAAVNNADAVYVVFGQADGSLASLSDVANGIGGFKVLEYVQTGGQLGASFASLGDVNNDGYADILIGTHGQNRAYVMFGKADTDPVSTANLANGIGGYRISGSLSSYIDGAGDINGDGIPDMVASEATEAGAYSSSGYVVFGQTGALPDAGEPEATGNVLANDAGAQPTDTLSVIGVQAGQYANAYTGGVGTSVEGIYGTLTLLADGSYTYNLDNGDRETNALQENEVVFDRFSYTAADQHGNTAVAEISIQITGAADLGQTIVTNGTAPIYLVGGDGNDTLQSGSRADRLEGGLGNDTLISTGIDTFIFNSPEEGHDTITGFVSGSGDKLEISAAGFGGGLVAGGAVELVTAAEFTAAIGSGSDGYFIFDNAGADIGTVYWDATGGDGSDAVALATLTNVTALQQSDFLLV